MRAKIIGTGSYLPPKVVTNDDLAKLVDTSDEWIRERTGIRERRVTDEKTATSDLAVDGRYPLPAEFVRAERDYEFEHPER